MMNTRITMRSPANFSTEDAEYAAFVLGSSAIPYKYERVGHNEPFHTAISVRTGLETSVVQVRTRGRLRVRTAMPENSFAIALSRRGTLPHLVENEQVAVGEDFGVIQSASAEAEALTPHQYEVFFLRADQEAATGELERLLDRPVTSRLKFEPRLSVTSSAGKEIARGVLHLYSELQEARCLGASQYLHIREIERRLLALLLENQKHNYTRILNRRTAINPGQVRHAMEFIEANAQSCPTLGEISHAAGTNARTLQFSFRQKVGCSPMQYLKEYRLAQARAEFEKSDGSETVTEIAARWGFFHFGRFAINYGETFGERPSETLGRRKRVVRVA